MATCPFEAILIVTQAVEGTTTSLARRRVALRCGLPAGHDGAHHDEANGERWEESEHQRKTLLRDEADEAPAPGAGEGASAEAAEASGSENESDELPRYLDQVEHPAFGLCDVMVVKGQKLKIRAADGTSRLREIHLGVMKVLAPEMVAGKRVFRLVKR